MITSQTLKNAAFAIEHDLFTDPDGCNYLVKDGAILRRWEPAVSSADAFELMVLLNISLDASDTYNQIYANVDGVDTMTTPYTHDRAQDYRNVIILCASKIGESIKCQS